MGISSEVDGDRESVVVICANIVLEKEKGSYFYKRHAVTTAKVMVDFSKSRKDSTRS